VQGLSNNNKEREREISEQRVFSTSEKIRANPSGLGNRPMRVGGKPRRALNIIHRFGRGGPMRERIARNRTKNEDIM